MNRIEFYETLDFFNIDKKNGVNSYDCYGITLKYIDNYYVIINGEIPHNIIDNIYRDYPESQFDVKNSNYIIYTKENLIAFLYELNNYFFGNNNINIDDIILEINTNILNKIEPNITIYEWMSLNKNRFKRFTNVLNRENNNILDKKLREIITEFDLNINPFINNNYSIKQILKSLENSIISANTNSTIFNDSIELSIKDSSTNDQVLYTRNRDSFSYQLNHNIDKQDELIVSHYYIDKKSNDKLDNLEEVIYINYYDNNMLQQKDIRYNITKGLIGSTTSKKIPVSDKEKLMLCKEIIKATVKASYITTKKVDKNIQIKERKAK